MSVQRWWNVRQQFLNCLLDYLQILVGFHSIHFHNRTININSSDYVEKPAIKRKAEMKMKKFQRNLIYYLKTNQIALNDKPVSKTIGETVSGMCFLYEYDTTRRWRYPHLKEMKKQTPRGSRTIRCYNHPSKRMNKKNIKTL